MVMTGMPGILRESAACVGFAADYKGRANSFKFHLR
jgi:hypothetical protein